MGCIQSKLRSSRLTPVVDIRGQRPQLQADEAWLPPKKMERPKTAHYKRRQSKVKFTKVKVLKKEGAPSKTNLKERPLTRHGRRRERKKTNSSQLEAETPGLHYEPCPIPTEELEFTPYHLVEVDSELSLIELEPSHHDEANNTKEVDISGIEIEEEPKYHWEPLLISDMKVENIPLTKYSQPPKTVLAHATATSSFSTSSAVEKPKQKKGVTFVLSTWSSGKVNPSEVALPSLEPNPLMSLFGPHSLTHCRMAQELQRQEIREGMDKFMASQMQMRKEAKQPEDAVPAFLSLHSPLASTH